MGNNKCPDGAQQRLNGRIGTLNTVDGRSIAGAERDPQESLRRSNYPWGGSKGNELRSPPVQCVGSPAHYVRQMRIYSGSKLMFCRGVPPADSA